MAASRRDLLVSKGWVQAVVLVVLFGFFVLGLLAYRTYQAKPPIPERVVDPSGALIYTERDVERGQEVFLNNGLMEYGSVFGHGAYLGPDYTADYLRRASDHVTRSYGGERSDRAARRTIEDFRTNRYDERTGVLELTEPQAEAHRRLVAHYSRFFSEPSTKHGLRPEAITDREDLAALTAFFGWTAWAGAAERPGHNYSYTNNWPPEPRVDNRPTANVIVWSVLSLVALLGGIGLLFAAFGRWNILGWHGREQAALSFRAPGDVALTPAQRACAWFFFVMAALFVIQVMVGAASQHYRAELTSFFGIDLAEVLPFNLMRTWHVQLAIFWVATSFVAAGIFLAPMIARREPKGQGKLAFAAARRARRGGVRHADRLVPRRARTAGRRGHELVRPAGLRVPRPRARLAGTALDRAVHLAVHALARAAQAAARRARGQHAVALLHGRARHPGLLRRGPDRADRPALHGQRVLALLGRPPVGGGLPRAVHDRDGRLHVRAARGGAREGRADRDLPRHHPLLVRWRDRHDAPRLLLRRASRAHGAWRLLQRRRGDPAHLPDRGGMVVPAARGGPAVDGRARPSRTAGR